ncbi:hypothetical protein TVAG_350460 [Trichomonas vaginalis G3]|uniref:Uncharacterized protein n=1 Tax=Trichomonas vaginalis (strain ATCC PRA-98 / G3) TaxID=412133 RepID=A2ESJ2_TRIV3|nr:hypothetical protein TVAGG3_0034830 [Trichomonas vaginalis G3]EAY04372.1 hypothetical protein TVAG_350460 [Trichomonas vaginalis G3]KAI5540306.1 hypothetical protein TVAGG3_0034830 [Trichomonas vaginalis G3]|eukprot:XP_001316595.1 hypothetical protein [Trichomonas vaginalis G3]
MRGRKKLGFRGRRREGHDHGDDLRSVAEYEYGEKTYTQAEIEQAIVNAKHPFEDFGLIESKALTPSQRAITSCIEINGEYASEEILLNFLQTHWNFIGKMNIKLPNNMPDTRILHINLAVKKKQLPLFVQSPNDPLVWTVNKNPEADKATTKSSAEDVESEQTIPPSESENFSETPQQLFQDVIYQIVYDSPEGITQEKIYNEAKPFHRCPGIFSNLPLNRRVKATLLFLKSSMKVFELNGCWSCNGYIPLALSKNVDKMCIKTDDSLGKLSSLSIEDLYNLLKQRNVY